MRMLTEKVCFVLCHRCEYHSELQYMQERLHPDYWSPKQSKRKHLRLWWIAWQRRLRPL